MSHYTQKRITNLKPSWYYNLSKNEKLKLQAGINEEEKFWIKNKPSEVSGFVICKTPTSTLTKGKSYRVLGHFCTLVTTLYGSKWNQFVTIKNDSGYTVKVCLSNFENKSDIILRLKEEIGVN